jgi:hypothetical protein
MVRIAYSLVVLTVLASLFQIAMVWTTRLDEDTEPYRERKGIVAARFFRHLSYYFR